MRNYFRTKARLQILIDNADRRPWVYEEIDRYFFSLHELPESTKNGTILPELPSWMAHEFLRNRNRETEREDYIVQYVDGFHDSKHTRTEFRAGDRISHAGECWEYVDSVGMSCELELQADDGGWVCVNRGFCFLRVYERVQVEQDRKCNE